MIQTLKNYCKVIEIGNFTKASKELFISQPALSISIKKLEKQLGCKLILRNRDGLKPTKIGSIVYKHAIKINRNCNNLKEIISEYNEKVTKNLNMGMIDNVGLILVSKIYKEFYRKHPNIKIQIHIDNSDRLVKKIKNNNIDFAIITKGKKNLSKKFIEKDFGEEKMSLVASTKLAKEQKDLKDINLISYNKDSTTYKIIKETLDKKGIRANFNSYSTSPKFILELVKLNVGFAFLPNSYIHEDIKNKKIKVIDTNGLEIKRKFALIYLKTTYLPKTTLEFIEKLQKAF